MQYEPIPGQPQYATEEETMSVIRAVLTQEDAAKPSRKVARAALVADKVDRAATSDMDDVQNLTAFVERTSEPNPRRRADDLPALQDSIPETLRSARKPWAAKAAVSLVGTISLTLRRVRHFRPSTRHLALASVALLIVLRPYWFLIIGVLFAACVFVAFLIFGSNRIWRGVLSFLVRIAAREPERATHLRARLDRFAYRWDGFLDYFPDGMVDGLYMPDFQDMQTGDAAHTHAMTERLSRMAHDT